MSDYCSLAEALSLLPTVGTLRDAATGPPVVTATVPTATQGAAILAGVTAELDMHLRAQGYATPATDAQALAYLKSVSMAGTAARIAKAKWPSDAGAGGDNGVAKTLRDDYAAGLAFIDSGGLGNDATGDSAAASFAHGFTDSEGTALIDSELITHVGRETEF